MGEQEILVGMPGLWMREEGIGAGERQPGRNAGVITM